MKLYYLNLNVIISSITLWFLLASFELGLKKKKKYKKKYKIKEKKVNVILKKTIYNDQD